MQGIDTENAIDYSRRQASESPDGTLCARCDSVVDRSLNPGSTSHAFGACASSDLAPDCKFCNYIIQHAEKIGFRQKYPQFRFRLYFFRDTPLGTEGDIGRYAVIYQSALAISSSEASFRIRRIVDVVGHVNRVEAIRSSELRRWLSTCLLHEHPLQNIAEDHHRLSHIHLIDTENEYIVKFPFWSAPKYAALSYVWGRVRQVMLLQENYQELTRPGSLSATNRALPRTIRDAITLCSQLEISFLWVDALCIVQDHESDKVEQIQNMDLIYRSAMLTVVGAAGDDANAGLSRLHASDTKTSDLTTSFRGLCLTPWRNNEVYESTWNQRGWTLQERVLSTRLLMFTEFAVFAHCSKSSLIEDQLSGGRITPCRLAPLTSRPFMLVQDIEQLEKDDDDLDRQLAAFKDLIGSYVHRKLSSDTDTINAFLGVLKLFEPALGKSYWGVPQGKFIACLQWYGYHPHPLTRVAGFPSWSWTGWKQGRLFNFMESSCAAQIYRCNPRGLLELICLSNRVDDIGNDCSFGISDLEPTGEELEQAQTKLSTDISAPMSHLLVFWAAEVSLTVSRQPKRHAEFEVIADNGDKLGDITLSQEWRDYQSEKLPFIVFSSTTTKILGDSKPDPRVNVQPMLIERSGSLAYRVDVISPWLEIDKWIAQRPQRRLVILG